MSLERAHFDDMPGTHCEGNQLYGRMKSMRHPEEKGGALRGWESREDSGLPFLETSQNSMCDDSPNGITKSHVWKGP